MIKLSITALFLYWAIAIVNFAGSEEKVVYEYKKYEKIDLGNLEIKGSIIAPGDLSVRERGRKTFELPLYERTDFLDKIKSDIDFLR